ncbi:MAG: peptidoglycan-associated lipoprotein Pal [Pseudomonadota bacterium]
MKSFLSLLLSVALLLSLCGCPPKTPSETVAVRDAPAGPMAPPPAPAAPAPVREMAANFSKVFFEFDSATLTSAGQQALSANARIMMDSADVKVEIQGHADERGTTDYNLSLGQKRAEAVKKYMVAGGVSPTRIATISYGEERPVDPSATEVAWSKNRRAEFRITWGQGPVSGTTE